MHHTHRLKTPEFIMRLLAALLLIGLAFEASATDLKNIKATVQLQDKATNRCWTNLKQTHEYAGKKFRNERHPDWRL